jgi:hypothetical protein
MFEIRKFTESNSGYFLYEIFMNWGELRIKIFSWRKKPSFILKNKEITT